MSISPAFWLPADFAALFGRQLEGVGLVKPAAPTPDCAGGVPSDHADRVPADEQKHDNDT